MDLTAPALLTALKQRARPDEVVHKHYHGDGGQLGVPMRDTFDTAKAYKDLPLDEVERLMREDEYEPRLAAFCVLDFQARQAKLPADRRLAAYELYLRRHDRIDSWDMVDRAAPQVIGRHLLKRSHEPLFELAASAAPLRRRTAMTAPLYWARYGSPADLADLFRLAEVLIADPDPVVSKPVGIALKYAGLLDEAALKRFLDEHSGRLQRPALRYAVEKLPAEVRQRYLG